MSLEIALQQNTNALQALIDLLKQPGAMVRAIGGAQEEATPAPIQNADKPAKVEKLKKSQAQAAVAENAASSTPAPLSPSPVEAAAPETAPAAADPVTGAASVTYQDAANAITKLSRVKGREAAVAVLAQFGAAKLPEVKPEQFADLVAACAAAEA